MRDGSATRKNLERCALILFVDKGITATTIKDISNAAQIAEGTLYRHFKSKDELAQSLFVNSYEKIIEAMRKISENTNDVSVQIEEMVVFFSKKFDEDPVLFRYLLLTQHHQIQYLQNNANNQNNAHVLLSDVINKGIKDNQIPNGDPQVYAAILMGIVLQSALARVYKRIDRKMIDDAPVLTKAILAALNIHGR